MKTRREFLYTAAGSASLAMLPVVARAAAKPAVAGINPHGVRQQIDGFGFSMAFHQARNLQNLGEKERTALLNLFFSPTGGMGFSILRNIVGDGPAVQKHDGATPSIEPQPGVWNWSGDEDQIWLMNEAKKRGCARFLSTVWSPPAWMKTNSETGNGGALRDDKYKDFGEYLATYVAEYKKRYDLDIYAISPTNEPNFKASYQSCLWNGDQLRKFLRNDLFPALQARGIAPEVVVDEHAQWSDETINTILADPICAEKLHIVAAHAYYGDNAGYIPYSQRTGRFATAEKLNKRIWQTEVSCSDKNLTGMDDGIYWAGLVHAHLTQDNVSAWLYWWGVHYKDDRSSLVSLDMTAKSYILSKRLFTLGHFARFLRPGSHRVDAVENPVGNVRFSAYLDPLGKQLICVAINDDSKDREYEIQVGDFPATACVPIRTSRTETHQRLEKLAVADGRVAVQAPAMSVTTFVFG